MKAKTSENLVLTLGGGGVIGDGVGAVDLELDPWVSESCGGIWDMHLTEKVAFFL